MDMLKANYLRNTDLITFSLKLYQVLQNITDLFSASHSHSSLQSIKKNRMINSKFEEYRE
jgi:hypothetical protein